MSNPFFEAMGGGSMKQNQAAQAQAVNPFQRLQELKAHPGKVLKQAGFNVPDGMTDARQIINHLLSSGQVTNPRLQMAQRMMGQFMPR